MNGKFTLWKMQCLTLQSMGRTNHKLPVHATRNVQTHLKSTVINLLLVGVFLLLFQVKFSPAEHAAVQSALEQQLGPQYISQRSGPGGQKVCLSVYMSVCMYVCIMLWGLVAKWCRSLSHDPWVMSSSPTNRR